MDERRPWEQAAAVLPGPLRDGLLALGEDRLEEAEEFRLRRGFPMTALLPEGERETNGPPVGEDELRQVVENATQCSAHTALDRVRQGFVTLRGGHRIGLCGSVTKKEGRIVTLRELSSLSVRVARSVPGLAKPLLPDLTEDGRFLSTLILAPPGAGKTTLLRDLVRALSDGEGCPPHRVSVADERGEIAALWRGEPQLYVGRHTDVLDGCSKAEGLSILIRGMDPQVAAADELGCPEDVRAAAEAAGCGVAVLATAHGAGPEDLRRRPACRELLELGAFRRLAVLERRGAVRRVRVEALS
ncbi:MAG: stage III sporulation protein AB [Oscillospiraceae bacterium]|nr:stage III sporulation protein AB [Oscillospiraceae bacterium]